MAHCTTLALLLFTHFIIFITPNKAEVPAVIVFGDSTADTGNNNQLSTVLKSNFQPYGRDFPGGKPTGRFSNGRISADFISEAFGCKPTVPAYLDPAYSIKDFATGVCFASAGTGYDNATSGVLVKASSGRKEGKRVQTNECAQTYILCRQVGNFIFFRDYIV